MRRATDAERERLNETFAALCRIESPSGRERACADWVTDELRAMGLEVSEDAIRYCRAKGFARLCCGDVCDLPFAGASFDLVLATERLRATKDMPRFVYIRPTEQALRRSGAELPGTEILANAAVDGLVRKHLLVDGFIDLAKIIEAGCCSDTQFRPIT